MNPGGGGCPLSGSFEAGSNLADRFAQGQSFARMVRQFLDRSQPMLKSLVLLTLLLSVFTTPTWAWSPRLESQARLPHDNYRGVVGENRVYLVGIGESLIEIARRGGFSYQGLVQANPDVSPWTPEPGTQLTLPYALLLPEGLQPGITVNLAEYRLFLLWQQGDDYFIRIYPIGLGQEGWESPLGDYQLRSIIENPSWTRPLALRQENPEAPVIVPPGEENPLGRYWLGLSLPGYGIHGTNHPFGIGRRVSHGCIRLYAADIEDLAGRVTIGMPVRLIYQPVKIGWQDTRALIEVHQDYLGKGGLSVAQVVAKLQAEGPGKRLNRKLIEEELAAAHGIPLRVSE